MIYTQPVTELIKRRSSRRSYLDTPIDEKVKQRLIEYLSGCTIGPFGTEVRFSLITASEEDRNALKGLGTYGFIRGKPGFIVGAVKYSDKNFEDYAYLMEKIILFATDLGLGTCWLGGSFNKSNFSRKINTGTLEVVPAVSPVGNMRDRRSTREMLIRWGVRAKMRLEWEELFFNEDYGLVLSMEDAGDYAVPLEMVRLGPSASNKQPWRVVREKNKPVFHFYLQRSKGYDKNQKFLGAVDLQRLDMGIAMCHFELSARELNLKGEWQLEKPEGISLPPRMEYIVTWNGNDS
jgi:hypothetical protein